MLAVAPVECEDADGARHRDAAGAQGPGRQVDEGQAVGRGHARNRRDPRPHLLERQETGTVRGARHEALTARDASARPQGFRRYRARGSGAVADGDDRARRHRADVASQPGDPLRERAVPVPVRKRRAVERRGPGQIAKRCRWNVLDDDVVRGLGASVDHSQRDRDRLSRGDRARRAEALLQAQAASERRGEHPLHVEGERRDRACGHGRTRPVDEEEHGREEPHAKRHAGHRGERSARVAHELAPRIAMHAGLASSGLHPPRACRRAVRAAGRALRRGRDRGSPRRGWRRAPAAHPAERR